MPGLIAFPSLQSQMDRVREGCGCEEVKGWGIGQWWSERVSEGEKERLRGVEWGDEEEEWVVMGGQWGVVWGRRGEDGEGDGERESEEGEIFLTFFRNNKI